MGMKMPAWFDMYGLTVQAKEDDRGIEESAVKGNLINFSSSLIVRIVV
jgi:hypothetical protein